MENQPSLLGYILLISNLFLFWYFLRGKNFKIDEQTQNKLNFTIKPKWFLFIGLFIAQLGIICLYTIFTIIPVTQLSCERVPQNLQASSIEQKSSTIICQLREFDFFSHQKSQKEISGLIGTRLEKQTKTDKEGKILYIYQVQLLTNTESIPFRRIGYSDYSLEEAKLIILKIKNFLAEPLEKSLVVTQDDTAGVYAGIGGTLFFFLVGLLIIAAGSFINCNFDKESNSLILSRYRWFGILGKSVFLYSLNEIVDIKVESSDSSEGGMVHRVSLMLASGETVPLSGCYSSGFQEKQEIVKMIKSFLAAN
ncbi:hypothetical protein VF14_20245 [Nostoc linckia z18]|uniref:PH domain-containing protein n=2 Tax=Nostoc linckia TaxID=92942 RepID=A0A9Q5ZDV5_NOSLI|nr:hypothetical protein [Nostoc linckia]PHK42054.1 hypothetical protein VF12_04140 [Nostoc linckia z15]PHK46478.1 hypothetical protein VF13_10380 [Nostoc linckia z16]PHJ66241.1 hypothetical protein VF02_08285 [Nostoc linckia z1]PHJ71609.1 hypothetical protein VF05_06155 [Nostoc linckia z3]PHJ77683.1 hypothetical protein VF03_03275 [Nostoc linckia z2]